MKSAFLLQIHLIAHPLSPVSISKSDRYFNGRFATYSLTACQSSPNSRRNDDFMTQPRRLSPLYSPFGCGSALLLVFVLAIFLFTQGGKMFSPGELTAVNPQETMLGDVTSHADIGGDCGQCHDSWGGTTAERCENCHLTIAQERQAKAGLHGRFTDSSNCQNCHTDHKGREADITALVLDNFDHADAIGFSLVKHREMADGTAIACQDCHTNGRFAVEQLDCITCHTDSDPIFMGEHNTLFGNDCLACHDGVDQMSDFDHAAIFHWKKPTPA